MCDVPVAAQQDFAPVARGLFRQAFQLRPELIEKAELGLLALVRTGPGRQVERNHRQPVEVGLEVAPFGIELGVAETFDDAIGMLSRINADAAVAFPFGGMEATGESGRRAQRGCQVGQLRLEFLDADDVGLLRRQPLEKSLVRGGTDTIQIQIEYSEHVLAHVKCGDECECQP